MISRSPQNLNPEVFCPKDEGNGWETSGCAEIPRGSNPGVSPAPAGFGLGRAGYYDRRS